MATKDKRKTGAVAFGREQPAKNRIDFGEDPATAGDIIQLFKVPKGTYLTMVKSEIILPEGATATAKLGTFDNAEPNVAIDADGLATALDLNATAGTRKCSAPGTYSTDATPLRVPGQAAGYFFDADGNVSLTLDHDMDTAIVEFEAVFQ